MTTTPILNDPPFGSEHFYNAMRLVGALLKRPPDVAMTASRGTRRHG